MGRGAFLRAAVTASVASLLSFFLAFETDAYTPGSGTLYSDNFDGAQLDPDWEQGNGVSGPSPWTRVLDGADKVFYADGYGPLFNSPTKHWARHFVHPVPATSFSVAFEYRSELGSTYVFDLEVEQRAPVPRKVRLRVDASGVLSLWRTENGVYVQKASTGTSAIPVNQKRWLRLAIEADPSGHPRVRCRVWSGGATAEPSTWTLEFLDERDTIVRVHRFELTADGPKGTETWLDDLDAFGDGSAGVVSSVTTIYLMELAHLDIGFTEPPDDIEAFAKTHLDQVLDNLDADPSYRWTIESGWWLDRWWERSTDTERQRMADHLLEGRLKLAAGYANLHTTTAGHEELARSIYFSSRMARRYGFPLRVWITDDVPGTSFAVPEILARAGIPYFVGGMNTTFGGRLSVPSHAQRPFWWVGPDGSRVLAWFTYDSYAEAFDYGFSFFDNLPDLYKKLGKKLPEQEEAGYPYPELLLMRGFDNHYGGFKVRDLVNQWNATYETPRFVLSSAEEFLDLLRSRYGDESFPSYAGDYGAAWSSSHANAQHTETWVREAHRKGRAAEALLAAGSVVDGEAVPADQVDFLYRRQLEVDEHSGAGGWPEYFTPEEMDRNNRIHMGYAVDARDTANALLEQGLDRALSDLPAAQDAIVAVNPLGRARDGWVRIVLPPDLYGTSFRLVERGSGSEVPYQKFDDSSEILFRASSVPAFGYRVYDLVPGTPGATPTGMLQVGPTSIENDFYRLVVDPSDGSVTSLYDKLRGKELVDAASAYDFNELASNVKSDVDFAANPVAQQPSSASVAVTSSGPLVASLEVNRVGTPHTKTVYRLYRNEDRVEIENVLDRDRMPYVNYDTGYRVYTVTFPFSIQNFSLRTETTTRFLDPPSDGFDDRNDVFDWHNAEHTLAFWDSTGGILYACDAVDAHNFGHFSTFPSASFYTTKALLLPRMKDKSDEYQFADGTIGPYEIEPGSSPIFRYTHHLRATAPGFDPEAASRFGFESLSPLLARLVGRRPGNLPDAAASFFTVEPGTVLAYTVKNAEDGDGLALRMTELSGVATTARIRSDVFTLASAERLEHDEEGGVPLAADGSEVLVPLEPYETATVRVRASVLWAPIELRVDKDAAAGVVRLSWAGGVSPYTVERAVNASFTAGVTTLLDEEAATSLDDPVLSDGTTYYYLVR
jgi:hypothetical protein